MLNPGPRTIYLKDYTPPAFLISNVELDIDLREDHALVTAALKVQRNPKAEDPQAPLELYGDELELVSVALDGAALAPTRYRADASSLTIDDVPARFELTTVCRIQPKRNTKLMGLYASQDGYFTQCEAEGFRRITYFIDRPDVMARYTTTLHADQRALSGAARERQSRSRAATSLLQRQRRGTGRDGKIRSPSRRTCSRWSRRSSTCSKTRFVTRSGKQGAARRSTSSPASSTRRASPCRRSRRR